MLSIEENALDEEFERLWESQDEDWMYKSDKEDAKYWWLRGRRSQIKETMRDLSKVGVD